jgi:hypothetical protein
LPIIQIGVYFLREIDMRKVTLLCLTFLIGYQAFPQQDESITYANSITADDLKEHLSILASDALEGRETGKRGQKMAAAYIEQHFKSNGLEPIVYTPAGNSFIQSFALVKSRPGKTWIKIGDITYANFEDFVYTGKKSFTDPLKSKPVFVGEGDKESLDAIQVSGKNVLVYCDCDRLARDRKAEMALGQGAKNVFIIKPDSEEDFNKVISMYKRYSSYDKLSLPLTQEKEETGYFLISQSMGAKILNTNQKSLENAVEKSKQGKYASVLKLRPSEITFYSRQIVEQVSTENVLGFIEGTDKKDEFIVLSAHYDHIGKKGDDINNGADDDGSGTVAILEMAQAFALAKKAGHSPRRSMLFLTVTGEEKGLLGSSYYVNHPVLPLESTIANLNIDMIGRIDGTHEENPNYVYLIGSDKLSVELHEVSEQVNSAYTKLDLDYTYNDDNDPNRFYYRSDHYNFAKNNIPIIFYFNGTHPDYHKPTDTVDKIEFELMEKRTKLVFHTAWEIANREDRISVDVIPEEMKLKDSN